MSNNNTEYLTLWVNKEEKAAIEAMSANHTMQLELIKEKYIREKNWMRDEFAALNDEVLKYRALLLTARQEFKVAQEEHATKLNEFWDEIYGRLPVLKDKVQKVVSELSPITTAVQELNNILANVSSWRIKDIMEVVNQVADLSPEKTAMLEILIQNFKTTKE